MEKQIEALQRIYTYSICLASSSSVIHCKATRASFPHLTNPTQPLLQHQQHTVQIRVRLNDIHTASVVIQLNDLVDSLHQSLLEVLAGRSTLGGGGHAGSQALAERPADAIDVGLVTIEG